MSLLKAPDTQVRKGSTEHIAEIPARPSVVPTLPEMAHFARLQRLEGRPSDSLGTVPSPRRSMDDPRLGVAQRLCDDREARDRLGRKEIDDGVGQVRAGPQLEELRRRALGALR